MAKRGENIHLRKDGRYEGRYIKARTADGKAVWGYVYSKQYAEVKEILLQKKAESSFYALRSDNPTFESLSCMWLSSISASIKASTISHYRYTLHHYILPVLGAYSIKSLTEAVLEQGLLQIIVPASTVHKPLGSCMARECLTMVRRICRYASHLRLIRPMEIDIKLPCVPLNRERTLTQKQQQILVQYVRSVPTPRRLGLLFALQMGLRIGEICGLKCGDFDLESGTLYIRRTVTRITKEDGHTQVLIQSPKTRSSVRELPIPKLLLTLLQGMYKNNVPAEAWFLSGRLDKPVEPRTYRKSIRVYLHQAGLPIIRPHLLRHTFATTCLQAGCDIKTVSELLGHSNSSITLKRYVHTDMKRKRYEMERIFEGGPVYVPADKESIRCKSMMSTDE